MVSEPDMVSESDLVEIDQAATELTLADAVDRVRQAAAAIPAGSSGDCDLCGEWSGRLVEGACAPCRDHYNLK